MGRITIAETDRAKAFALFDQDETVGRVATVLFAGHWYKAKKLREEYDGQKSKPKPEPPVEPEPPAEPEEAAAEVALEIVQPEVLEAAAAEEPELWDITLQVPARQMDRILAAFTPQEKADAICGVLQARLNVEG